MDVATYLPITCPGCSRPQGEFNSFTGCLRLAKESTTRIFGAIFTCKCGRTFRWNGEVAVKKLKRAKNKHVNTVIDVAKS